VPPSLSRRALLVVLTTAVVLALPPGAASQGGTSVREGKNLYGRYCIACHGANGAGVTSSRAGFGPGRRETVQRGRGPSLRGVGALAPDFYLRTGYMPLKEVGQQPRRSRVLFSEGQIAALVAYVSSLGHGPSIPQPHPERGSLSEGQKLFTDHCAGCHQVVAEGGYVTGAVAPRLEDATPRQVAEAVRIGPYVMPRFSSRQLSPHQVDSIIRYVEYAKDPDDRGGWAIGHLGPVPEGLVTWFLAATALVAVCVVIGKRLRRE
jgi:ubiquinol-cytochrome c reductase cytochrome c subunit